MGAGRQTGQIAAERGAALLLGLIGIALLLALAPALANAGISTTPDDDWVTNGPVYAIARSGNTIYLGGDFTQVGPRTGPAVTFTGSSSTPDASFPEVAGGEVRAAISDGAGGWYIGGSFTHVGGVAQARLAHVLADGTVDPNFAPTIDAPSGGAVLALALSGSTLYVGGVPLSINGQERNGLAAVSASNGAPTSWNPAPRLATVFVETMSVSEGVLYIGGDFSEMASQSRNDLAAFDTSTGDLTSWNPDATRTDQAVTEVKALAVSESTVYLAGDFNHVAGQERAGFAAVDTSGNLTTWNPSAGGCNNEPSDAIGSAIAASASAVYIAGCFTTVGGESRAVLAAVDPTSGEATSWNPHAGPNIGAELSQVSTLALAGSTLYVSGTFTEIGGQERNGLAALDTTTAAASTWNPNPNVSGSVKSIATDGSQVFVGGSFTSVGGDAHSDLAAIDATSGEATGWNPNVTPAFSSIDAISLTGGLVYVGGSFSGIGGQSRANLAALDPTTGLATSWNPGANRPVLTLLTAGSTMYAGGDFTSIGGRSQSYLAAIESSNGTATSWSPQVSGEVRSLALSGSTLYLSGSFSTLGGQSRASLGAVSTTSGTTTSWAPQLPSAISGQPPEIPAIALSGNTAYATDTQLSVAAIDATTGEVLPWQTFITGVGLAVANSAVYTGGTAIDANSGLTLPWNPQLSPSYAVPYAVTVSGNHVYLGGAFTTTDTAASSGFAAFTMTGPLNTEAPTIQGTAGEGHILTAEHGAWTGSPASYTYQWLRCQQPPLPFVCRAISGATSQTYTPTEADSGAVIEVEETATNAEATSEPVSSPATTPIPARTSNTIAPAITGTPSVGQTLDCSTGNWSNNPTSYQYSWQRDGLLIRGASTSTYTVTAADAGHSLACQVTAENASGSGMYATSNVVLIPGEDEGGEKGSGGGEGITGGGTTGGSGSNPTSPPAGNNPASSTTIPSASAIQAALAATLNLGKPPTIASLLKAGGYTASFTAPGAGTLTIQWTSATAHAASRHKAKPVVIATGSKTFSAAGRGTITLRLTAAGRALLKGAKTLRVTQTASFKPSGGSVQTKQATITLRAGQKRHR